MKKYTQNQKIEALKFFEEGFSAREIFEVLEIPIGTLYRWKSEDPKSKQPFAEGEELLRLRRRVEELEKYIEKLERAKEKRRDSEQTGPIFGRK